MKTIKALAIFNATSLLIHIAVAYFVQTKMINEQDIGEVSAKYESLFTPAGFTFGIWIVIYATLSLFCLYHIIITYKHDKPHRANSELLRINGLFIIVNLASAFWLFAWANEQLFASVLLIYLQLLALVLIHHRLNIYDPSKPSGLKLASQFPLSIYLGWISVATVANTSSYLTAVGWDALGLPDLLWVIIIISFTVLVGVLMIFFRRNFHFALVVCWALYGIIKKQTTGSETYQPIIITAWSGIGLLFLFSIIQWMRNIKYKKPRPVFPSPVNPVK